MYLSLVCIARVFSFSITESKDNRYFVVEGKYPENNYNKLCMQFGGRFSIVSLLEIKEMKLNASLESSIVLANTVYKGQNASLFVNLDTMRIVDGYGFQNGSCSVLCRREPDEYDNVEVVTQTNTVLDCSIETVSATEITTLLKTVTVTSTADQTMTTTSTVIDYENITLAYTPFEKKEMRELAHKMKEEESRLEASLNEDHRKMVRDEQESYKATIEELERKKEKKLLSIYNGILLAYSKTFKNSVPDEIREIRNEESVLNVLQEKYLKTLTLNMQTLVDYGSILAELIVTLHE